MKGLLVCFALIAAGSASAACGEARSTPHPPVVIHMGGSDSMQLLARDLANAYHLAHPYVTFEIHGGNSSSGLAEFARGSIEIALVSRNPGSNELREPPARAMEIARDGIVVVVHPSNTLTNVSREQLAKIFSGEILKWSELTAHPPPSGDDSIQVLSRENGSGTRSVFEQTLMAGRRVTLTALIQPSSQDTLRYVQSNPDAIGYVAFNLWSGNTKTRALSIDGIPPTEASVQASTYPLMQTYYLVVPLNATSQVSDFVDFVISSARTPVYGRVQTTR